MDQFLRVNAVSYEGSIFGWDVTAPKSVDSGLDSTLKFGFHAAQGSLKALAVSYSGKYMVCGGMDEHIRVFNMYENRTLGELNGHTGCITCLEFVGDKFIVSGSEDNNLCIWRVQDWLCVHILGGHKAAINDISVHPSGKLALSVSKDNTLKVWNLVQGRCAFTRRLHGPADKVQWNASGTIYLLVVHSELQVYDAADNSCTATVKFTSRINQACFTDIGGNEDGVPAIDCIAIICENKTVVIVDVEGIHLTSTYSLTEAFDGGRPRDMYSCAPSIEGFVNEQLRETMQGEGHSLCIVSSNGSMAVVSAKALCDGFEESDNEDEDKDKNEDEVTASKSKNIDISFAIQAYAKLEAEPRLTAVCAWNPSVGNKKKRKSSDTSEEEEKQESEGVVDSKEKKSKNKKKKQKEDASEKKTKVSFAN
jgi:WD40 repeat protein